jgi:ATP-dependent DNA helicase RecG
LVRGEFWRLKEALEFLHHPSAQVSLATLEDRSHPAWIRLKAEELLAQQLSQLQSRRERDAMRAPALVPPVDAPHGGLRAQLMARLSYDHAWAEMSNGPAGEVAAEEQAEGGDGDEA